MFSRRSVPRDISVGRTRIWQAKWANNEKHCFSRKTVFFTMKNTVFHEKRCFSRKTLFFTAKTQFFMKNRVFAMKNSVYREKQGLS